MRYFLFLIVMIASLLPQNGYCWRKREVKLEPQGVYFKKYKKRIQEKWGWKVIGIAVGTPGGVLEEVGYRFQVKGPLTEEEIRRQTIWVVKEMVEGLNSMPELLAKIKNPPATEEMVDLILFFVDDKRQAILNPEIGTLSYTKGNLYYKKDILVYNEKWKRDFFRTTDKKKETFEEALQILGLTREELKDWDGEIKTPISN